MSNPMFSIIMPAYNDEKYIRYAIESIIKQTYSKWELIVIDDGSEDNTLVIAQKYCNLDKRIKVIHQKNSGTAAAARNTALKYVRGDFVQILDSDDYISEDYLEKMYESIEKSVDENTDIMMGIAKLVNEKGDIKGEIAKVSKYIGEQKTGEECFELSFGWKVHGWLCVKTELICKIRFDPELINGDELTTRKLFLSAKKVKFTDGIYYYRENADSTTRNLKNRHRKYEMLITDGNIYKYAVEKGTCKSILDKCSEKWCKSIIAHEALYLREESEFSITQKQRIQNIISSNLSEASYLTTCRIWTFIIAKLCNGKMERLIRMAKLYNYIWRLNRCR